ncbi:gp2.31 [Bacillus phage SPO1]|uniref:Gp2.31 n=1 Tax=Bacillus phage SP01 TaxID=2884427 RepID=B6V2Z5_BPSP1|nr:gp2.31 [Bacillus phage SPO1]ACI90963.1 gp2.31 [Bacillus phage SPO1]
MNQVEKFNKRWGIKKTDEKVVNETAMKKAKDNEDKVDPTSLLKQSGLKEAAIVISSEGMDLFSKMFANSVSTAVDKALADHQDKLIEQVDNVVTTRLGEVLEGLIEGMRKSAQPQIKASNVTEDQKELLREMIKKAPATVVPTDKESMELYHEGVKHLMNTDPKMVVPIEEVKNISTEIFYNQGIELEGVRADRPSQEPSSEKRKPFFPDEEGKKVEVGEDLAPIERKVNAVMATELKKSYDRDDAVGVAVEFLKNSTEPQLAAKVNKHLESKGIEPYKNPTTFMNKVMKKEPRVQKAGFGTYTFVETTFKPVL